MVSWLNHETQIWCVAKGVPLPEIQWNHNGTVMSFRQSAELISNLTFIPKKEKDFGSYTCTARNPLGSTKRKVTVVMLGKFNVHKVDVIKAWKKHQKQQQITNVNTKTEISKQCQKLTSMDIFWACDNS